MKSDPLLTHISNRTEAISPISRSDLTEASPKLNFTSCQTITTAIEWYVDQDGAMYRFGVPLDTTNEDPKITRLQINMRTIEEWSKYFLQFSTSSRRPLENNYRAFEPLRPLLAGLDHVTSPGDLLVFLPTGKMSDVPLHAIPLEGRLPVIQRNPGVYATSLTLFRSCIDRTKRSQPGTHMSASIFAAAYQEDNKVEEREMIFSGINQLKDRFGASCILGNDLDQNTFQTSLRTTRWMHYHGHAHYDASQILTQSFVLGRKDSGASISCLIMHPSRLLKGFLCSQIRPQTEIHPRKIHTKTSGKSPLRTFSI